MHINRYYMLLLPAAFALTLAFLFFVPAPGAEAGSENVREDEKLMMAQVHPERMRPERLNTWGAEPGSVIRDGRYLYRGPYPYPWHHPCCGYPERPWQPCPHARYIQPHCFEPEPPWYKKKMPATAGRVSILVDPLHARVTVDGQPLERQVDLAYEAGLLTGEYQIEVTADGYASHRSSVKIGGGEIVRLEIRLEPSGRE